MISQSGSPNSIDTKYDTFHSMVENTNTRIESTKIHAMEYAIKMTKTMVFIVRKVLRAIII